MPIRELTDAEKDALMSQQAVDDLPAGTVVMVKWSGGNGPHRYEIEKRPAFEHPSAIDGTVLDYVGTERPRTRVFRPDDVADEEISKHSVSLRSSNGRTEN